MKASTILTDDALVNKFINGEKFAHLEILTSLDIKRGFCTINVIIATRKSEKFALEAVIKEWGQDNRIIPILDNGTQTMFLIGNTQWYGRPVSKEENLESIKKYLNII